MKSEQQPEKPKKPHALNLENRSKGFLTGVEKVSSSNETAIVLETSSGGMTLTGTGLKINKFDNDTGTLSFEGSVSSVRYSAAKLPFFKRIFG